MRSKTYTEYTSVMMIAGVQPISEDEWNKYNVTSPAQKPSATIKCACGHYADHPMYASRGTSCPDCYDDMSN